MADITGLIPITFGSLLVQFIQVLIIAGVLTFTDRFMAHDSSISNSLKMALIAYFLVPIALSFVNIPIPFVGYLGPLVAWMLVGEFLLKGERLGRMKAAAVAFIIYLVLNYAGLPAMIIGMLPF